MAIVQQHRVVPFSIGFDIRRGEPELPVIMVNVPLANTRKKLKSVAYIQNLTLIACFLGFGLGCLRASERPRHLFDFKALACIVMIVELPWANWKRVLDSVVGGLAANSDLSFWAFSNDPGRAIRAFVVSACMVSGILLLVIATMIPLGAWVATLLQSSNQILTAYSVNLLGSLAGVWVFAGLSFLHLPPVVWFVMAFALLFATHPRPSEVRLGGNLAILICLLFLILGGRPAGTVFWSPYQKLEVISAGNENFQINVNNSSYMSIANLSTDYLQTSPALAHQYAEGNSYDSPYRLVGNVGTVLVVGSGAGNDVAAALRHGAERVDAVEIDPVIYGLGYHLHPEKPYQSPKVHVVLDDARDYMRRATGLYDVIVFGLLDSHTQSSSLSNTRIDNYVYTYESFQNAKRLLKPAGVLILKFEVNAAHTWIGQRFYSMLNPIFLRPPVVFYSPGVVAFYPASIFIESQDKGFWDHVESPDVSAFLAQNAVPYDLPGREPVAPTTDDWPYLYLKMRSIPRIYLAVSTILMCMALLFVRRRFRHRDWSTWQFFFLGAGFLLLEAQMVSRLSLYFGSTWLVNCVVLSFILLVLVLANFAIEKSRSVNLPANYALLVLTLIGTYYIPWTSLPWNARIVGTLVGAAFSVTLLFAGIVFTESFRRVRGASGALGANILGAVGGGLAQNLSFIFGMKVLVLVAVTFYFMAAVMTFARSRSIAGEAHS